MKSLESIAIESIDKLGSDRKAKFLVHNLIPNMSSADKSNFIFQVVKYCDDIDLLFEIKNLIEKNIIIVNSESLKRDIRDIINEESN